jgi:hypothetical protein
MKLKSLNEKLYDDFFVQELDSRLETDPLMTGGLFDLFESQDSAQLDLCIGYCSENNGCVTRCGVYL